jgi:hypothetical protein
MRSKGSDQEGMLQRGLSAILTSDLNAFVIFPLHVRKYKRTYGSLFHYHTASPSVYSLVLSVEARNFRVGWRNCELLYWSPPL